MDAKITEALNDDLDPALVKQRQGVSYIEGHTAIAQANRIFGFDGWGYELVAPPELQRIENVNGQTGEVRYTYAYSAVVRVTAGDAPPRTDYGYHAVQPNKAGVYTVEAHDTAGKAAVTDALKRALRSFGAQFGNSLYGNGGSPANRQPAAQHRNGRNPAPAKGGQRSTKNIATAAQLKRIEALSRAVFGPAMWETKRDSAIRARTGGEQRPLTKSEADEMIANLERLEAAVEEEVDLQ